MNGADSLVQTLLDGGVDVCFANPGTSEMHFVAALDQVPGMRCVLCLFEGVASGATDGYARMARKPAATLLHLGPGLGNALANIHNAKRGNVGMLNLVGDHATYHLQHDAPLTSDIAGIARPMSDWVHTISDVDDIVPSTKTAIERANTNKISTLILPADVSWSQEAPEQRVTPAEVPRDRVSPERLHTIATLLTSGENSLIFFEGLELTKTRSLLLAKLIAATGIRVATPALIKRVSHGQSTGQIERLPYLSEHAIDSIKDVQNLIVLGGSQPVSFFAYPSVPSIIAPSDCTIHQLATLDEDIDACLEGLVEIIGCQEVSPITHIPNELPCPQGALSPATIAKSMTRHMPQDAIVVDESITASAVLFATARNAVPHDWLSNTGGSIGWGLPGAVGAAIACPDRKIICVEGDGSAMYTNQALWSMVRENLDVTVVILSNRKYAILEMEFARTGARGGIPGPNATKLLDISNPSLAFVDLATSMGMKAVVATTAEDFDNLYCKALAHKGPMLIDAQM